MEERIQKVVSKLYLQGQQTGEVVGRTEEVVGRTGEVVGRTGEVGRSGKEER